MYEQYHEILRLHFRMPKLNFHFSNSPGTRVCNTRVWNTDVEDPTSLSINHRRVTNPRQASHWASLITWHKLWPLIGQSLAGFLLVWIAAMRVCLAQSNLMICLNNLSQGPNELLNSSLLSKRFFKLQFEWYKMLWFNESSFQTESINRFIFQRKTNNPNFKIEF